MQIEIDQSIFPKIANILQSNNIPAYLIGGYVRDLLLQRPSKDIDIVVVGDGPAAASLVAHEINPHIQLACFKNYGTAMFRYKNQEIEFVGARKESYRKESRNPEVCAGTLDDDLRRRDFTINALAISLNADDYGTLIDPFNGLIDLHNKIIRTPLNPDLTFSDDPLRMLRAIRFATQLQFFIEPETLAAIKRNRDRLQILSKERITTELNKILLSAKPSIGFHLLNKTELLPLILPELEKLKQVEQRGEHAHKNNFYHSLEVLDNIAGMSDKLYLRWAALLHDIAKPATKRYSEEEGFSFHGHEYIGSKMLPGIFRRLRLPMNEQLKYVQKLVQLHMRPIALKDDDITDSALRRLLFEAGEDIEDLMLLCHADVTSKNERKKELYRQNFLRVREKLQEIEEKDSIRNFQPPISGETIMHMFNLPPSRAVGKIKNALKDAILDGIITNNYTEAYAFVLRKAEELNIPLINPMPECPTSAPSAEDSQSSVETH